MSTKKVKYNKQGIEQLPDDKPVLYRIETEAGRPNYIGVAQRGRLRERLSEHLGKIPGATVRIEQFDDIKDAMKKEINVIRRAKAKYHRQGK
jgi:predicted GIY-YIG superfamily endonuclease